jgi:hypothetical protein
VHSTDYIESLLVGGTMSGISKEADDVLLQIKDALQVRYDEEPSKLDEAILTSLVNKFDRLLDEALRAEAPPVDPPLLAKHFPGSEMRRVASACANFLAHARSAGFYASGLGTVNPTRFEADLGELIAKASHLESFAPRISVMLEAGHTNMGW